MRRSTALRIIDLVQKRRHIRLADKLRIEREVPEAKDRAQAVREVLRRWACRRW